MASKQSGNLPLMIMEGSDLLLLRFWNLVKHPLPTVGISAIGVLICFREKAGSLFAELRKIPQKQCSRIIPFLEGLSFYYDSVVTFGSGTTIQTKRNVRLIAYTIEEVDYWIATNRFDLEADQIAEAYRLRWQVKSFFAWWKRHLSVYHTLACSEYGLNVQIFAGLITYLLLAIYCH